MNPFVVSRNAALAFMAVALAACVPNDGLLEGRPCPCAQEQGWYCSAGVCVRGEGPDTDAGTMDAGTMDAGQADAGPDREPPPTPTDCWTQVTPCDWSNPDGFEFVEGPSEVLADLTISGNPAFSPDGCVLYYSESGVMSVARRADATSPFVVEGPVSGVDQASSGNSKPTISPDGLELYFTSDRTDGMWHTIHRTRRAVPEGPWGVVEEVTTLSFPNANNWDGVLAPHGLRYYWSPNQGDNQNLFVGERPSPDEPFTAGVAIAELAGPGGQAEPAVSADGRVLVFITEDARFGEDRELAYATRTDWLGRFGEVRRVPGSFLATDGAETESTVSPNACEIVVRKGGASRYMTYSPL